MKKIIRYIETLLISNDHAIVPGLGGFVVQSKPAVITPGSILPPSASVSFNPLINQNDGLLALEIARSNGITYREATALIEEEVSLLRDSLQANRKVELGNCGFFEADEENHPVFIPADRPAFLPGNLGYNTLYIPSTASKGPKTIRFNSGRLFKYVAAAAMIIGLLFPDHINENAFQSKADINALNFVRFKEITITPDNPALSENTEAETITGQKKNGKYKVVVAVFRSRSMATDYQTELSGEFADCEVISTPVNSKVILCSFDDYRSAVDHMRQLRSEDDRFADAWVMRK